MIGNFNVCVGFVLDPAQDGQPLHTTPNDPGGATAWGITSSTWSRWLLRPALIADMRAITPSAAAPLYEAWYWHPIAGDRLPAGLDLMVFDHGVTCGARESALELQKMLGFTGGDLDGAIGPITLAAIAEYPIADLIAALSLQQAIHYKSLTTFAVFGHGWLARTDRRHAAALKMLSVKA